MFNQSNRNSLISLDSALRVIPDRSAMHKALLRNQLYVPPLKDAISTKDFMVGILEARTWVPRTGELQLRNCADQPNKKELAQILFDVMVSCTSVGEESQVGFFKTAELVLKHPPSPSWTITMIATIDPGNVIFSKDYVRPRYPTTSANAVMVPSFGDFFEGLPQMQPTKNAGRI